MTIGVDGGALSIADDRLKVGVYRVTFNLLRELGKLDVRNDYRIYSFLPIDRGAMDAFGTRIKNVVLAPSIGWATVRLPLELKLHPVDVYLGLSQSVPLSASHIIGFIYDLGFLHRPQDYPGSAEKLEKQTWELVGRSRHIVTISHASSLDIQETYGVEAEKITVVYSGIDARFSAKGKAYRHTHPYVLFVGSLKPGKNVPLAIRAFAQVLKKSKRVTDFIIIGSTYWLDPEIAKTIKELEIGDRVILKGFVSDADLPSYYRGAAVFIAPSQSEGFCLPAIEAQACGTPVLVSDVGAFPEVIGKSGIIVASGDVEGFTKGLDTLVNDKKKHDSYRKLGLANAKRFSWKQFAQTVLKGIGSPQ